MSGYVGRLIMVYPLDGSEPFKDRITQDFVGLGVVSESGISFTYGGNELIPYKGNTREHIRPAAYRMEFIEEEPTPAECWKNQLIATTIDQSQTLMNAGLDPNTADMIWWPTLYACGERMDLIVRRPGTSCSSKAILAWSLSALIKMIPMVDLLAEGGMYRIRACEKYNSCLFDTPIDAACFMVLYLRERKVI